MPNDYGHEYADKELKSLEKRITKEYKQAAKEVEKKMNDYLAKFADKDAQMKKRLGAGEITASEYAEWRMRQMFTGDRWKAMSETLSADLVNADKIAAGMINDSLPSSYAENFNYGTYEIEHGAEMNTNFVLYDKDTVANLMKNDPKIIPKANVDIPKDMVWNRRKLISAVAQGVLQGESISGIARRLQSVTDMGRNAAVRNARTYTTAAENKGRIDSYDRAKGMGINLKKEWIATLDERTRMEHRHLDGMAVDNDEPFETDGYKIMYPGDPDAEPEMIYNCRCTLVARIVDYKYNDERNDSKLGDMTYEEWKHAKDKPGMEVFEPVKEVPVQKEKPELILDKISSVMKTADFEAFYEKVDNAENRKLYEKYGQIGRYELKSTGGKYKHGIDVVEFSYERNRDGIDKYSTLAHEFNHLADAKIGRNENLHYTEVDLINETTKIPHFLLDTLDVTASTSDEFLTALRMDMENLKPLLNQPAEGKYTYSKDEMHGYFQSKTKLGELIFSTEESFNASSGIQDAIDGFFGGMGKTVGWGHGDRYYNREYNGKIIGFGREKSMKEALNKLGFDASSQAKTKQLSRQYEAASEAWANVGSAVTTQGKELEMMEKYMPKTVEAYKHIVEVI